MNSPKATFPRQAFPQLPGDKLADLAALDPSVRHVRPYIDLRSGYGPVHAQILSLHASAIACREPMRMPWQSNPAAGFRGHILKEGRLGGFACRTPGGLAESRPVRKPELMKTETKGAGLVGIARQYPDDALVGYKRRLARGVATVMPRLLEKVRPESARRAAAALAVYHRLPEPVRDELVYHPFFCSWWVKVRSAFSAGDRGQLAARLEDFPAFVLIPAL
jgi:hypothetical protein